MASKRHLTIGAEVSLLGLLEFAIKAQPPAFTKISRFFLDLQNCSKSESFSL